MYVTNLPASKQKRSVCQNFRDFQFPIHTKDNKFLNQCISRPKPLATLEMQVTTKPSKRQTHIQTCSWLLVVCYRHLSLYNRATIVEDDILSLNLTHFLNSLTSVLVYSSCPTETIKPSLTWRLMGGGAGCSSLLLNLATSTSAMAVTLTLVPSAKPLLSLRRRLVPPSGGLSTCSLLAISSMGSLLYLVSSTEDWDVTRTRHMNTMSFLLTVLLQLHKTASCHCILHAPQIFT